MRHCLTLALLVTISALLSGCEQGSTVAEGGVGGTGISMGRVTQVGSVYVNGTHYDTDSVPASFTINGEANRTQADISVGMVVTVTGSRDPATASGIAETVAYHSLLVGPIDTIDPANTSTVVVMGQTVTINEDTVFDNLIDNRLLQDLTTLDRVEISGFVDSVNGNILATRIVVPDGSSLYRVTGTTSNYDVVTRTFRIGGLNIDLSAIDPASVPADGSFVHISGTAGPVSGSFLAESLFVLDNGVEGVDGTEAELEGIIASGLDGDDRFIVNGQTVDASTTPYSGDPASLTVGRVVSISGILENGILLAERIDLKASSSEREEIAALIQPGAVDADKGTVVLMGRTIQVDNTTIYENDLSHHSTFRLNDLQPGHYLEAKVFDNLVVLRASKLELESPPSSTSHNAELEGYATNLGANRIEILDVTIDTSSVRRYTFNPNRRIEVEGFYDTDTGILTATHIDTDEED